MSSYSLFLIGIVAGIALLFALVFIISWIVARRERKDFTLEYEAKSIDKDNNATTESIIDILKKCPKDATVVFAVNADGNMRIRLDNIVDYNATLNEVVFYPFDVPTEEGGYSDMLRKRGKKKTTVIKHEDEENEEDLSTEKK